MGSALECKCKESACGCDEESAGKNGESVNVLGGSWHDEVLKPGPEGMSVSMQGVRIALSSPSRGRFNKEASREPMLLRFHLTRDDHFGLSFDEMSHPPPLGFLVVREVDSSSIFNKAVQRPTGLFPGDVIREVNGLSGDPATLRGIIDQVVESGGSLDITVDVRPRAFNVALPRVGPHWKKLGVSVKIDKATKKPRMLVDAVRDQGLVPTWNQSHGSSRICVGDCITEVNGVSTSAEDMYGALSKSEEGQTLHLQVETPSRDSPR